jgi:hypothetical protein
MLLAAYCDQILKVLFSKKYLMKFRTPCFKYLQVELIVYSVNLSWLQNDHIKRLFTPDKIKILKCQNMVQMKKSAKLYFFDISKLYYAAKINTWSKNSILSYFNRSITKLKPEK